MVDFIKLCDPKILRIEKSEQYFDDPDWILEPKVNGRRIQSLIRKNIEFAGRYAREANENISDFQWKFSRIFQELKSVNIQQNTLFDGEVYLPGRPVSTTMQMINLDVDASMRLQELQGHLHYVIFDILALDGNFLTNRTFYTRRKILENIFLKTKLFNVHIIDQYASANDKRKQWQKILSSDNEEKGVVFKFKESEYECSRSKWWLKLKKTDTYEGVILNFKLHNKYPDEFVSSIEVGQYRHGQLVHVASVSGLTKDDASEFRSNIEVYKGKVIQFRSESKTKTSYKTPRFDRVRYDKKPQFCIWED